MSKQANKQSYPLQVGDSVKLDYTGYFAWYDELNGSHRGSRFHPDSPRLQLVDKFTVVAVYSDAQLHPDAIPSDAAHIVYHNVDLIVPQQFLERVL